MTIIAGVQGAVGNQVHSQSEITDMFTQIVAPNDSNSALIERIHSATKVSNRGLALAADEYLNLKTFDVSNDAFIRVALQMSEQVINAALQEAGVRAEQVDLIMATSTTGIATPSLETRLVPIVGFRNDIKRIPLFGLGCAAGAAGIARVHDYLSGHPNDIVVLLSVELCSLTLQSDDVSIANIVSSGLFGDGAGAVVMVGAARAKEMGVSGPRVVASKSRLYPNTEDAMGWNIGASGFRIFLSAAVGETVTKYLGEEIADFLKSHKLTPSNVHRWVAHPGGPKILEALESSLALHAGELDVSWKSLSDKGNLSSAAVIHILRDVMDGNGIEKPVPGTPGLLLAMGPGFSSELVLLEW
jgi:alkylresorcinol/alkylpyrone synthase